jgi:hypothetical protein
MSSKLLIQSRGQRATRSGSLLAASASIRLRRGVISERISAAVLAIFHTRNSVKEPERLFGKGS